MDADRQCCHCKIPLPDNELAWTYRNDTKDRSLCSKCARKITDRCTRERNRLKIINSLTREVRGQRY